MYTDNAAGNAVNSLYYCYILKKPIKAELATSLIEPIKATLLMLLKPAELSTDISAKLSLINYILLTS